jgi:thiamine-phosphate pyrophosphorylase
MTRRQTVPQQWLIADERMGDALWLGAGRLPRGSGVLVLRSMNPKEARRLRHLAGLRDLAVIAESAAARVHNMRELRQALLNGGPFVLISPIYRTRSHPDWRPLPRMRAATLARLAGREAIALGGMNRQRYARIRALGFIGWAAIDAFRT